MKTPARFITVMGAALALGACACASASAAAKQFRVDDLNPATFEMHTGDTIFSSRPANEFTAWENREPLPPGLKRTYSGIVPGDPYWEPQAWRQEFGYEMEPVAPGVKRCGELDFDNRGLSGAFAGNVLTTISATVCNVDDKAKADVDPGSPREASRRGDGGHSCADGADCATVRAEEYGTHAMDMGGASPDMSACCVAEDAAADAGAEKPNDSITPAESPADAESSVDHADANDADEIDAEVRQAMIDPW